MLVSSSEAISSSIPSVNTDEAITNVPTQIKYKNTGCDAIDNIQKRTVAEGRRV
jgi:hypothetical protein